MKLTRKIEDIINCIDDQMLSYSINYSCQFKYNILDYFKVKKQFPILLNTINETIKEIVAENSLKCFTKNDLKQYQKEYTKYIDFKKTNVAQADVRNLIIIKLKEIFNDYNYEIVQFNMMPCDICHSLHAALN